MSPSTPPIALAPDARDEVHESRARSIAGLVWALSRKNFQVRYKRATLGVLWAVLQPTIQAGVLAFVFIELVKIEKVPDYALFVLAGVLPWTFFAQSLSAGTTAIVDNAALVRKVALPLAIFPAAAVGGTAIAFSASLVVLVLATLVAGKASLALLLLPVAVVLEALLVVGLSVLTSAYHVAFRDVRYAVESMLLIAFYATPVLYDQSTLDNELYRNILRVNPMAGVLSLYRAAVVGREVDGVAVAATVIGVVVIGTLATVAFRRRSDEFADLV